MGKNKLKKFADMTQWSHVFEYAKPEYVSTDCPLRGHWNEMVFKNDHPVVLELGCGKGEYSVGLAEIYPEKNFIGIDIKGARMWTGAKQVEEKALNNVVFLRTHIEFLTHFFAPGEVSEIWLTFPDPQMKKVRKRLTSTCFMQDYEKILCKGACIHLKTDSHFMFTYTCEMAKCNALPVAFQTDDLYGMVPSEGASVEKMSETANTALLMAGVPNIQTFYEKQWLQRGLSIKYIRFSIPSPVLWKEPDVEIEPDEYRSFGRSARVLP